MLKRIVKVGAVTNLSDARYCAGMWVNFLGFCFDKNSQYYVSPEKFEEIAQWVSGVPFVGEFTTGSIEEITEIARKYKVDIVQVNSSTLVDGLKKEGFQVMLEQEINELDITHIPDYLILNSDSEPLADEIAEIENLTKQTNVLLATGLTTNNLENLLELTKCQGIALKGSSETRPGFKDYDELADIFEILEDD